MRQSLRAFAGKRLAACLGVAVGMLAAGYARASDVTLFGANTFASLASADGDGDNSVFTVNGNLVLASGASITCNDVGPSTASACPIHIIVTGTMEMQPGSAIRAENTNGAGAGGNITIEVDGASLVLDGSVGSTPGAVISSKKGGGSDTAGAGTIQVFVGDTTCGSGVGDMDIQAGALVTADGINEAGSIGLYAGHVITIDGKVSSTGSTTNGRGGPIFIKACCDLLVGVKGVVTSRGQDAGADLVHLEACAVDIKGLVESTGPGHQNAGGKNLCNDPPRPGKPANSTACVEIWSGTTLFVDGSGGNAGEVNADTGFSGGTQGTGWIDALARGDVSISGGTAAPYALHANQGLTNGHGGSITVISNNGSVTTSGKAIQANDTNGGGRGGSVRIEAGGAGSPAGDVNLGAASIQAAGAVSGGGSQAGGTISATSFNGKLSGAAPGELNAKGGPPAGSVTLNSCLGATYTGTASPSPSLGGGCGGAPVLPQPADTGLPASGCTGTCRTSQLPRCPATLACTVPAKNPANVVTVTNCSGGSVTVSSSWTQINLPTKDIVVQCALNELAGTDGVRVIARSIRIDGPNGGSVHASGTSGLQLTASASPCGDATVEILSAAVQSANSNASLKISACGDIVMNNSSVIAGVVGSFGGTLNIRTTSGRICADTDTFYGEHLTLESSGDLAVRGSSFTSDSPLDYIRLISDNGSVLAGGNPTTPPCLPNTFAGGIESNMTVTASGIIDFSNACVDVAENITFGASGIGFDCANDIIINLAGAEIRNDFGKPGDITATACGGTGRIDITDSILVSTGTNGGGVNPNAVAILNGGKKTSAVCPAIPVNPPGCINRVIDTVKDNPVCADEADRALHHVTGAPKIDR